MFKPDNVKHVSVQSVRFTAGTLEAEKSGTEEFRIIGRVIKARWAGSKLAFIDIVEEGRIIQVKINKGLIKAQDDAWNDFKHVIRKGDWYSFVGYAHMTKTNTVSLEATQVPTLQSPSLHQIPNILDDAEAKARRPHVATLVNLEELETLQMRSHIETWIAGHLTWLGFYKVSTPLLTAGAGGAVARPFETVSTELSDTKLNLRISPELWLKRLVIGGMSKVYEMGPAFRNEGVDATHNPEFTICEFYMQFAEIESLMTMTEELLQGLHRRLSSPSNRRYYGHLKDSPCNAEDSTEGEMFGGPFSRLPFIATLEQEMGQKLPRLDEPQALDQLKQLFESLQMSIPANPTLPRLLDALCGRFIEPLCKKPTFITEHPAVMSPLSKSFKCPQTGQMISARAELFIEGQEYANMYEEENSPFEQRRKFVEQLRLRDIDGEGDGRDEIDESYLEALEWGLPPTGGWGMGIDRLVMLLAGRKRIGDVLPFGTLRNVVGLATRQK
ncbi:hypothetical protein MBLNU457_g0211t1 [Dothideomycetes sp. NU457]